MRVIIEGGLYSRAGSDRGNMVVTAWLENYIHKCERKKFVPNKKGCRNGAVT